MDRRKIMILGSGRLAYRLICNLKDQKVPLLHVNSKEFKEVEDTEVQESSMDYAKNLLVSRDIAGVTAVCLVDGDDAVNLYLLMAVLASREDVPIFAAFFNENLVAGLSLSHKNVKIFDPASIVSRCFVDAIPRFAELKNNKSVETYRDNPRDSLVLMLLVGLIFILVTGAIFFRFTENVDWQKSFYLVITVITSVNFNDAELTNGNALVQYLRMGLMLATYAYVILALAFIVDHIVKRRTDVLSLGRRRYHHKGHVVVCGLGRVGYAIVRELMEKKEKIIIIESDPDNKYLPDIRSCGVPVLIGDATLAHYLIDAGICRAKALICAIDSDLTNLEIGLNARSENNGIRLLLRIHDQSTAQEMKRRLNIHYVFSKSFTTAKVIYDSLGFGICSEKLETEERGLQAGPA